MKHFANYMEAAKTHKWEVTKDAQDKLTAEASLPERPVYTYGAFIQSIVCFIVADDQVSISQPYFNLSLPFQT